MLLQFLAGLTQFSLRGEPLILVEFLDSPIYELLDVGRLGRLLGLR